MLVSVTRSESVSPVVTDPKEITLSETEMAFQSACAHAAPAANARMTDTVRRLVAMRICSMVRYLAVKVSLPIVPLYPDYYTIYLNSTQTLRRLKVVSLGATGSGRRSRLD